MSAPTKTRQQIRRAICSFLEMEFYQRWDEVTVDTVNGANLVISELTQPDTAWERQWAYVVDGTAAGETAMILASVRESNTIVLEAAISGLQASDKIEILSISPRILHKSINEAIMASRGFFFRVNNDKTLFLQEDKLTYSLTNITPTPWVVQKVWLERPTTMYRGEVSAAGSNYVEIDGLEADDDEFNDFLITVYGGDASGEYGTIADTLTDNRLEISGTWGTTPSVGDKVAWYNTSEELLPPYGIPAIDWPALYWPDEFRLRRLYRGYEGARFILQCVAPPQELSDDTDTSVVPVEYLKWAVGSSVFNKLRTKPKVVDDGRYRTAFIDWDQIAQQELRRLAFTMPADTFWERDDMSSSRTVGLGPQQQNPLDW